MPKGEKASRVRQVQFRMDPELLKRLRLAIIEDDAMHSMADLFNDAAVAYLHDPERYKEMIVHLTGGKKNGTK